MSVPQSWLLKKYFFRTFCFILTVTWFLPSCSAAVHFRLHGPRLLPQLQLSHVIRHSLSFFAGSWCQNPHRTELSVVFMLSDRVPQRKTHLMSSINHNFTICFTTQVDPVIMLHCLVSIFKAFTLSSPLSEYLFPCLCFCFCPVTPCQVSSIPEQLCSSAFSSQLLGPGHTAHTWWPGSSLAHSCTLASIRVYSSLCTWGQSFTGQCIFCCVWLGKYLCYIF